MKLRKKITSCKCNNAKDKEYLNDINKSIAYKADGTPVNVFAIKTFFKDLDQMIKDGDIKKDEVQLDKKRQSYDQQINEDSRNAMEYFYPGLFDAIKKLNEHDNEKDKNSISSKQQQKTTNQINEVNERDKKIC